MTHVVVLGGGVGGVTAANRLRRNLPETARVTVVERSHRFLHAPSLLWVMSGDRLPEAVHRPLPEVLGHGIDPVRAEIRAFDPAARAVETEAGPKRADFVIVALGADYDLAAVPGFRQGVMNLYDLPGAVLARRKLSVMDRGHVVIFVAGLPHKSPPAPYEAAMLADDCLRRRGVRSRARITLVTPEPRPLAALPEAIGEAMRGLLAARGVELVCGRRVVRVDPGGRTLVLDDGARLEADALLGVPVHRCPDVLLRAGLASSETNGGWVPVDRHTLETEHENVYAVGDATGIPIAGGRWLPKAGGIAGGEARVAADRVLARIAGRSAKRRFGGAGACHFETGGGEAGRIAGEYYAEPEPRVRFRRPAPWWHWARVWLEKRWLRRAL